MRKSQRPITVRTSNSKGGRSAALKGKPKQPFYLPEDEEERPRNRSKTKKKRGKEDFIENTHEAMQEELQALMDEGSQKKVNSKFKKSFEKYKQQFDPENPDFRIDQAANSFNRSALDMLLDLIPLAEETVRKTQKEGASYALIALLKQIEELQNSIRMNDDIEGRISTLKSLIQATFVRIADMIIRSKFDMHKSIDNIISDPKKRKHLRTALDDMILAMGKPIEEYKERLQLQVGMYIAGDPAYLNPEAAQQDNTPKKKRKKRK